MKDEKSMYLIVDSCDIYKKLTNLKNESSSDEKLIHSKEIFEKYNVLQKYQKIIIKRNNCFFSKYEAEEYTMGFPFDLTAGTVREENGKKYLIASNPNYNEKCNSKVIFETEVKYSTFEDVMSLLVEMDENNYLKSYLQSIKEFFDIHVDLELIEESWKESGEKPRKALRLYKKKVK